MNTTFTSSFTRASCPGFNITLGVSTYEGKHLAEIGNEETNQTVTTTWQAVRDLVVWKAGDEEGKKLCFPKATATVTENHYPNGTSDNTIEGSVLIDIDGTEYINGVGPTLPDVGAVYQKEGSVTAAMDAEGITTFTKADGTYLNVCDLLSASAVDTSSSTNATVNGAVWIVSVLIMIMSSTSTRLFL